MEKKQWKVWLSGVEAGREDIIRALCEVCTADYERVIATRDKARHKLWESSSALLER